MKATYALAVLATTVGLVAGCGGSGGGDAAPPTSSVPQSDVSAPATPATTAAVPAELDFTAKTVGGEEFSGESLVGKPAVFWFWAPWCPTCQREAPDVASVARANPEARFVGVAALDQEPAMQEFVDRYDIGFFPNIADLDGSVWQRFGVTAQPAFAFVGADGSVDVVKGTLAEPALSTRVATLLNP
ncbi:protein disulfide oxidoreductase [Mycolicibacterium hippocampi]|uniref:protein disulfide oxidoreductase n=1 Tax=Mycolicibacterium hippocampi TaxID=659824 RepID=UPI0035163A2B